MNLNALFRIIFYDAGVMVTGWGVVKWGLDIFCIIIVQMQDINDKNRKEEGSRYENIYRIFHHQYGQAKGVSWNYG